MSFKDEVLQSEIQLLVGKEQRIKDEYKRRINHIRKQIKRLKKRC